MYDLGEKAGNRIAQTAHRQIPTEGRIDTRVVGVCEGCNIKGMAAHRASSLGSRGLRFGAVE